MPHYFPLLSQTTQKQQLVIARCVQLTSLLRLDGHSNSPKDSDYHCSTGNIHYHTSIKSENFWFAHGHLHESRRGVKRAGIISHIFMVSLFARIPFALMRNKRAAIRFFFPSGLNDLARRGEKLRYPIWLTGVYQSSSPAMTNLCAKSAKFRKKFVICSLNRKTLQFSAWIGKFALVWHLIEFFAWKSR